MLAILAGALAHTSPVGAQEEADDDYMSDAYLCSLYTPAQLEMAPWCGITPPQVPVAAPKPVTQPVAAPLPKPAPTPPMAPVSAPPAKAAIEFVPSADNTLGPKSWKKMSDGGSLRQTPESAMAVISLTQPAKAIGFSSRYQIQAVAALTSHTTNSKCFRARLKKGTVLSALTFVVNGQDRAWGTTSVDFTPEADKDMAWVCDLGNGVYVGRFDGCGNFFLVVARLAPPPAPPAPPAQAAARCERVVVLNVWDHNLLPTGLQSLIRSVGSTERGFGFDRGTTAAPRAVSATIGPQLRASGTRWTSSTSTFMVTLRQVIGDPATSWDEGAVVRSFTVTVPAGEPLQLPITESEIQQYAIDVRPVSGRFVYPRVAVIAFPREWRQCGPNDTFGRLHLHVDREG
jgi:hypothetical protein